MLADLQLTIEALAQKNNTISTELDLIKFKSSTIDAINIDIDIDIKQNSSSLNEIKSLKRLSQDINQNSLQNDNLRLKQELEILKMK